jgi:hypothetical protein
LRTTIVSNGISGAISASRSMQPRTSDPASVVTIGIEATGAAGASSSIAETAPTRGV